MGETTAQVTLDGYVDPTLGQLASQAYVQAQIAEAVAGSAYTQTQLPAGTQGQVFGPTGVAGVPALINPGALNVTPANGTTARSLSALFGDSLNLKNLGALLNGTPGDQTTIDSIYASLANGSVVNVPTGGSWSGTLTSPSPTKQITWLLEGTWPNIYNAFVGDGDATIQMGGASLSVWKQSLNTQEFSNPILAVFWNQNPNYTGPYSGNYVQNAAIRANYLTGPTSQGNTGAFNAQGQSFGMGPSSCYEVLYDGYTVKYGNNSLWASVLELNDLSGRIPQAFSAWLFELDNLANGHDISPMAPNNAYYVMSLGNRAGLALSMQTTPQPSWSASTSVTPLSTTQTGRTSANVIEVTATDSNTYTYVCSTGGTTGTTQPTWNPPAVFTGSISSAGLLTVTAMQSASPAIAVNQIITGSGFVVPVSSPIKITSQVSGTAGGVGTYQTSYTGSAISAAGMYAALQITDGSAVWDFGTEFQASFHTGYTVDANSTTVGKIGTAFGVGISQLYNAAFDCSQATLLNGAAAIRLGINQGIDFSYLGTKASQNLRTLNYSTYAGSDVLVYANPAGNCLEIFDTGVLKSLHNTLDDGSGNVTIFGNSQTIYGTNPELVIRNGGDTVGGFLQDCFSTLYFGENVSGKPYFALALASGKFGTVNQSTTLQSPSFRNVLDDGSGNMSLTGALKLGSAYTAGTFTATGYINITDSGGTIRKIPCA